MLRTSTLLAAVCAAALAYGQAGTRDCAAHTITERYLAEQGLPTDVLSALPHVESVQRGGTYTVPVVVHVVYNTAAENVSDAAINAIINEMNQDYSQSNPDLSGVRSQFTGVIGNVGFEFCLAQVDPSGNPTTGITRTQTTETWFDPDNETNLMKSPPQGKSPWNPSQYLNIWVCDITSGAPGGLITVGYAYLPVGGVVGSNIDGLVIDYNYGLDVGDRTATHEIGHYFGLNHTFDDNGGCGNADGFTDTPNSDSPTFSCSNTNLMKCGVLTQYENFMDYANCSAMFTDQQAAYMAGIITGVRAGLLTSPACQGVGPTGYCTPTSVNGTSDGDFINTVQLGSINNANTGGTSAPTYTNYSASQSTTLSPGTQYTLTIQGGTYQPDHYAAWIDYDQDETFETAEKLGEFITNATNQTQTITFTVPANATVGTTRMRVRGVYHNTGEPTPDTDPCFAYAYGETEDYGITIGQSSTGPCIPTSANGTSDGDFINRVAVGTINNANSGGDTAPTYTDFSASHATSLIRGSAYTLTVQGGDYQPDHYAAWIDYDQDDTFETGEKLGEFVTSAVNQTQTISFTVPVGAPLGSTTMRVRGVYHNTGEPTPDTDPCFDYAWGETEDYGITITTSTGVDELVAAGFSMFPNPANEAVNLKFTSSAPAVVSIVDLQGRTVSTARTNGALHILDLHGIAAGAYMVQVLQDGRVSTERLQIGASGN
ncbi:MAG: GEVED domain-containing protein [Flavobacteriales bacterium]|nr:zinc-dependent metalloprotease [Flavobacteriales bacterium]